MKLNVYSGRDLQNFLSLLNQCETKGVTDIRFIRERLQNHINSRFKIVRVNKVTSRLIKKQARYMNQYEICPSCGKKTLRCLAPIEGLQRKGCECQYSTIIKEISDDNNS